jgi:hypothetical protein
MNADAPAPPTNDRGHNNDSDRASYAAPWRPMSFKAFLRLNSGFGTAKAGERKTD